MSALIGLVCGVAVLAPAWAHRPRMAPRRVRELVVETGGRDAGRTVDAASGVERMAADTLRAVGERVVARAPVLRSVPEAWVGTAMVVVCCVLPWSVTLAAVLGGGALGLGWWTRRRQRARDIRLEAAQVVALFQVLTVLVGAGATLRTAFGAIRCSVPDPLRRRLDRVARHLAAGAPMSDALAAMTDGLAAPHAVAIDRLRAADAAGSPVGPMLRSSAESMAGQLRRGAEIRARRLPVLMLLPLVCCVLPAFVVLAIVPMVLSGLPSSFPLS